MNVPTWTKPALWGAAGGAVAAVVVGFAWGGWVMGEPARELQADSAEAAVILAFTPLCVARAENDPATVTKMRETSNWEHYKTVVEAGWVANVGESYRTDVARSCATAIVAAMETTTKG